MISGENWSSGFREEEFHGFIPVYSTGARADNPWGGGGKIFFLTKTFYYFDHTL